MMAKQCEDEQKDIIPLQHPMSATTVMWQAELHRRFVHPPNYPFNNALLRHAVHMYCTNQDAALIRFGPVEKWNVSCVSDMSNLFENCIHFNDDISEWDVSNVVTMQGMFKRAHSFNQPIGTWQTSSVKNMNHMFNEALHFNGNINNWNVEKLEQAESMFERAKNYNQPMDKWRTLLLRTTKNMFRCAISFNQNISTWDMQNIRDTRNMFYSAETFNQPDMYRCNFTQIQWIGNEFSGTPMQKKELFGSCSWR